MKHTIKIKELCQCNHISKEHAELIVKEIQSVFNINNIHALVFEVILTFKGITGISLEAASIIRNYIFDNKLEKSIYLINMTQYVRQVFFHKIALDLLLHQDPRFYRRNVCRSVKWQSFVYDL